jgi:hypothetical protein
VTRLLINPYREITMRLQGRVSSRTVAIVAIVAIVAMGACAQDPSAPAGALVGRFGAQGAEISLSAEVVDVRIGCGLFRGAGPVFPDSDGRFEVALAPRPGNPSRFATLRAVTDGTTIDAEMTVVHEDGQGEARLTVRKGVAPDYTILSCVVPTE